MIKQLLFACIAGCIGTIYYLQYDPWFKQQMGDRVCNQLSSALDCSISQYTVKNLNLFSGSITFNNLKVTAHDSARWYWSAKNFSLSFSWIELLLYGTLDIIIHLDGFSMQSEYHKTLAIQPHLYSLFYGNTISSLPIIIKQIFLKKGTLKIDNEHGQTICLLNGSVQIKKINNALKSVMHLENGHYAHEDRIVFQKLFGAVELNASTIETLPNITIGGSCSLQMPYLDQQNMQCHISGSWHNNRGLLNIKNNDHSFDITTQIHNHDISITAHTPISSLWRWIYNTSESLLTGTCKLHAKGNLHKNNFKGYALFKEVKAADNPIGSLGRITFEKIQHMWSGTLYGQRKSGISCNGSWQFDQNTYCGSLRLVNNTALFATPSSQWFIPAHATELICSFDSNYTIDGSFRCSAQQSKLHSIISTQGSITGNKDSFKINGNIGSNIYNIDINLHPTIHINTIKCSDAYQKNILSLESESKDLNTLAGEINFSCIRELLNIACNYDLQGEGKLKTRVSKNDTTADISLELINGTIRLPQTYNFINGFCTKLTVDWINQNIILNDLHCQLHKGILTCKHALLHYADDGSISFASIPLLFNDCLLNIQKDLFATVSGRLMIQQPLYAIPTLKGIIILDRSQLNENLFSYTVQQSLVSNAKNIFDSSTSDMGIDIALLSSNPVRVKTPFLETDAHIRLALSNTIRHPNITGSIQLYSGELTFPYKPLYINKGSIYFMPNQLYDPIIEIEARNTIKKFNINMQVTGSVKNHHISLSSSPVLSEEQIVALLLVGSQEESLNIVMPALIMQNVKQLLFGSEQKRNKIEQYFTGFLKPFKHITLVPSFVDQTGRGGLRGSIEINVHDRLRALIQKNFNLTEDTRFEIEYLLSDDISLRGVRDERRDVSGELEMRWKF